MEYQEKVIDKNAVKALKSFLPNFAYVYADVDSKNRFLSGSCHYYVSKKSWWESRSDRDRMLRTWAIVGEVDDFIVFKLIRES